MLQVYRASPDGAVLEQLTRHDGSIGAINALAPSPDGRYLAYSVQSLLQFTHPYAYQAADEGWTGIVDTASGAAAQIRPAKFRSAETRQGLVWDAASEELLIIGDSLPLAGDDPAAGRQVLWATPTGEITGAINREDHPAGSAGWIAPLGDIRTLLFLVGDQFYIYSGGAFRLLEPGQAPPLGMEIGRRPIGILPAPIGFPGEQSCDS